MRIEGELIKLLELSKIPLKGENGESLSFLEIFKNLFNQFQKENEVFPAGSNLNLKDTQNFSLKPEAFFIRRFFVEEEKVIPKSLQKEVGKRPSQIQDKSREIVKTILPQKFPLTEGEYNAPIFPLFTEKLEMLPIEKGVLPKKSISISIEGNKVFKNFLIFGKQREIKKEDEGFYPVYKDELEISNLEKPLRLISDKVIYSEFKYAEGVINKEKLKKIKEVAVKDIFKDIITDNLKELKGRKETKTNVEVNAPKAFNIEIDTLPKKVETSERLEGFQPVLKEALFKEEGKVKRASIRFENLRLELKLVKDKVDINFFFSGKENFLNFFDYLRISHILNSMGLRVESFSVNGNELGKVRVKHREKDNIYVNELSEKDRDSFNNSSSFSIAL